MISAGIEPAAFSVQSKKRCKGNVITATPRNHSGCMPLIVYIFSFNDLRIIRESIAVQLRLLIGL